LVNRERLSSVCWTLAGAAVLAVWAPLGIFLRHEATKGWTSEKVWQALEATLPAGSTRTEVQGWLDSQGFPYGVTTPERSGSWMARSAGLNAQDVGVQINAGVPDPNVDWGDLGGTGRISLTFFFDKQDKLLADKLSGRTAVMVVFREEGSSSLAGLVPLWWLLTCALCVICCRFVFVVWRRQIKDRFPIRKLRWVTPRRLAVCLLVVALACIAFQFIYSDLERRGPFWDKYQQIQPGMLQKEIEAFLGPPVRDIEYGGIGADQECTWKAGAQRIVVDFNVTTVRRDWEYGAIRKYFYPRSTWEKLRDVCGFARSGW
jgi:hypothetical protein